MSTFNDEIQSWVLFSIAKGDVPGHAFHGNQYAEEGSMASASKGLVGRTDREEVTRTHQELSKAHMDKANQLATNAGSAMMSDMPGLASKLMDRANAHEQASIAHDKAATSNTDEADRAAADASAKADVAPFSKGANYSQVWWDEIQQWVEFAKGAEPGHPFEGNQYTVAGHIGSLKDGQAAVIRANGRTATVHYNSRPAMGDNGRPARGYTKGEFTVFHGEVPKAGEDKPFPTSRTFAHSPQGPTLLGAKQYAADQAASHVQDYLSGRVAKGGPGSGPRPGGEKNWGDRNSTPSDLAGVKASDHASSWNQVPMTDRAARIMEAVGRYGDAHPGSQMNKGWSSTEQQAKVVSEYEDAIPHHLSDSATKEDLDALTDNNAHTARSVIEGRRPDLAEGGYEPYGSETIYRNPPVQKGDAPGHPFHGNQYTGGNAGEHFDNYRPMDTKQTLQQIGRVNVAAISGGRVEPLKNSHGETVGIKLPVGAGYAVNVLLHPNDTYTVQRTFTRSGVTKIKGQLDGVYADEVGEQAYQASSFRSNDFGGHKVE